jgi:hypothetical protein
LFIKEIKVKEAQGTEDVGPVMRFRKKETIFKNKIHPFEAER